MLFSYTKVIIAGCGGAGKSTLAREIGRRFSLPVVHLDRLWWLPGWQARSEESFDALLADELARPAWIMDGNFRRTFERRLKSADLCLFLDYPEHLCMESVRRRTEEFRGRNRPDMTGGCPERIDAEFEQWIRSFRTDVRPAMIAAIERSSVPHKIFKTRSETAAWLDAFSEG